MDGGESSLNGKGMQAGRKDGHLLFKINPRNSQDCNGKAFW
jgi:hypothetical protein